MTGQVYLVGSGPGDPELLTVKARRLIEAADVVLHDKLPGPEILASIPEAKREDVGKRAGGEWTPQEYTNHRLVELAGDGKTVARLKGGDPFVFGRGGEEAEHLAANGVPFEYVPGVTKLPAYTGELRDAGMDPETPVALVERATWPGQRVAVGTLETIVDVRDREEIEPPAITVIGDVAATRERVAAFLQNGSDGDEMEE
ncbi:uroporphyrinogen-III C-methyltransferase [Halobacteriales archaeon SW_5_68_122]|nr:MAG: uroporphyrinogen-III C-methyltransferase [Halobacteriales archaeon SW_5_68_122]